MAAITAELFRMEMKEHICPSGLNAKALLERKGVAFKDNKLTSCAQTDAFKSEHSVETTPQIWIDGKYVGGADQLGAALGLSVEPNPERGQNSMTAKPSLAAS